MLDLFRKRKISENTVANIFVNGLMRMVEMGFPEIAATLNESPEFDQLPNVDAGDFDHFLLIALAGNLDRLEQFFPSGRDRRVAEFILEKFAVIYELDKLELARLVNTNRKLMSRLNHPSKNVCRGMTRALLSKYDLLKKQHEYFREMKAPDPILEKRLMELMPPFLWDWENFLKNNKVV